MGAAPKPAAAQPADPLAAIWRELDALRLTPYVADLDAHGFTVIPPEVASPNGLAPRLLDAVLDVAERRTGTRPDLASGATHAGYTGRYAREGGDSPFGELLHALIFEGRVFEEALMNPVLLAMATYLCGYSVVLSSMGAFLKGPNQTDLKLHCDTLLPPPFPPHALVCNATYALTPFNRENGATAFVPGSHKWCRAPREEEAAIRGDNHPGVVAVEAEPGALIVWHGATWHAAFARSAPGLRVSMPVLMTRPFMRTEEDLFGRISEEALQRNPARFAVLVQQGLVYGFHSDASAEQRSRQAFKHLLAYHEASGGVTTLDPLRWHLYG